MNAKKELLLNDDEDIEFLKSLKNDFFTESLESLEKCEASLLNYEATKSDLSLMDYKRTLHSIKGSAKAVDEAEIALLIHKIEDTVVGEKNDHFFEVNLKFLDLAKNFLIAAKNDDTAEADSILKTIAKLF